MAASDRKIAEAKEHVAAAEKCLKTGLFKWKPDYDGAAMEYGKAAVCFRNAKAYEQAKDIYLKTADIQLAMRSLFHAAKSTEQAALLCKEMKNYDEAADLSERASQMYLENGTVDTAALALEKAGKMIEAYKPERAICLFLRAVDVAETEDRPKQAAELIRNAGRLMIRCKKHDEAAKLLHKEIILYAEGENFDQISKVAVGLVLLHLHRDDYVEAEKAFKNAMNYPGFGQSTEAALLENLLDAFDEGDPDKAEEVLKQPAFKYLDNAFVKLSRDLKLPGGGVKKSTAPSGGGEGAIGGEEEDDEEIDLK